ncbi:MAG: hypothetical protein HKN30_14830 [Sulfitobacter sp.]|nr:hypothetical protein [Sulfitobacter sp.]
MSERNNGVSNALTYSAMGIIAGIVFAAVFWVVADYEILQAIFAGIVTAVIVTLLLALILGSGSRAQGGPVEPGSAGVGSGSASGDKSQAGGSSPVSASEGAGTGAAHLTSATPSATPVRAAEVKPSKELPGQKELSGRKGSWKYEAEPGPSATEKAPKKTAAPAAKAAAAPAAVGPEEKPDLMEAPRGGSADDLKKISGVGPKLEQTLNDMGIWHFDQIAKWTDTEIAWVDNRLKFKGRIVRDDWIGQSKVLATGGETEFSKRKKK